MGKASQDLISNTSKSFIDAKSGKLDHRQALKILSDEKSLTSWEKKMSKTRVDVIWEMY